MQRNPLPARQQGATTANAAPTLKRKLEEPEPDDSKKKVRHTPPKQPTDRIAAIRQRAAKKLEAARASEMTLPKAPPPQPARQYVSSERTPEIFVPYNDAAIPILFSDKIDHHTTDMALQIRGYKSDEANYIRALELVEEGISRQLLGLPPENRALGRPFIIDSVDVYVHNKKVHVAASERGLLTVPNYLKHCGIPVERRVRFKGRNPPWYKDVAAQVGLLMVIKSVNPASLDHLDLQKDEKVLVFHTNIFKNVYCGFGRRLEGSKVMGWFPMSATIWLESRVLFEEDPSPKELEEALLKHAKDLIMTKGKARLAMNKTLDDYLMDVGYAYGKYKNPEDLVAPRKTAKPSSATANYKAHDEEVVTAIDPCATPVKANTIATADESPKSLGSADMEQSDADTNVDEKASPERLEKPLDATEASKERAEANTSSAVDATLDTHVAHEDDHAACDSSGIDPGIDPGKAEDGHEQVAPEDPSVSDAQKGEKEVAIPPKKQQTETKEVKTLAELESPFSTQRANFEDYVDYDDDEL